MTMSKIPACPECAHWGNKKRRAETFELGWGAIIFNIDRAKRLIGELGLVPQSIDVASLRSCVTWPKPPDVNDAGRRVIRLQWARINYDHVPHVDATIPIILATFELDGTGPRLAPIDGHHRIARAMRDGLDTLPAFILDEQATRRIMRRRRPAS